MLVSPSSLPLDPLSSLWIKPTFRVTRRMATGLFRHFDRHEVHDEAGLALLATKTA